MSSLTIGPQHHAEEALQVTVRQKNKLYLERAVNVIIDDSAPSTMQEAPASHRKAEK